MTSAEFAKFVEATAHMTVAEVAPDPRDFPGAAPDLIVRGSQVFSQPYGPVSLNDWMRWSKWEPRANWRDPYGKGDSRQQIPDHPVVHIGWNDAVAYAQ